jgi:hypothetical protein
MTISRDSLSGLFSADQDGIRPLNLPELALLNESHNADPQIRRQMSSMMKIFADLARRQGLKPILLELALISDNKDWNNFLNPGQGQRFVSVIDLYDDVAGIGGSRRKIADAWVASIGALASTPEGVRMTKEANFIVLSDATYDSLTYKTRFRSREQVERGADVAESQPETVQLPFCKSFRLSGRADDDFASDASVQDGISKLISGTLRHLPEHIRKTIEESILIILPFARPFLHPTDVGDRRLSSIIGQQEVDEGALLSEFPDSAKDPGGCVFAILQRPAEMDDATAQDLERRFALQAQYLLTISGLIEARRNLLVYYHEQNISNTGTLLHQFKNSLVTPLSVVTSIGQDGALTEKQEADIAHAKSKLEILMSHSELMARAIKEKEMSAGAEEDIFDTAVDQIEYHLSNAMSQYAQTAVDDSLRNIGKYPEIYLRRKPMRDWMGSLKAYLLEPNECQRYKWIGEYSVIIVDELVRNLVKHGILKAGSDAAKSLSSFELGSADISPRHSSPLARCSGRIYAEWSLGVRRFAGLHGNDEAICLCFANYLDPSRLTSRKRQALLSLKSNYRPSGTGIGQLSLGKSVDPTLPDLAIEISGNLDTFDPSNAPVFEYVIPIGRGRKD